MPRGSRTSRRDDWRMRERQSCGLTEDCMRRKPSARSSSARWSTTWSAAPTTRRGASSTTSSSCSSMRIRMATSSSPTGTCAIPTRSSARCRSCRGCTRSTSATTTIATSSCPRRRRPRTRIACCITSGFRRCSTIITRAARSAPSSIRRRYAIPTTTISTLCWCSASSHSAPRCTRDWRSKERVARQCGRAGRTTAGGTAASATRRRSTTPLRC